MRARMSPPAGAEVTNSDTGRASPLCRRSRMSSSPWAISARSMRPNTDRPSPISPAASLPAAREKSARAAPL